MFEKNKNTVLAVLILGIAAALIVSLAFTGNQGEGNNKYTLEESKSIAKSFVERSPTYSFDGYDLELNETLYPDIAGCEDCYTFVFDFKSRHGGYGNRSGKMVTQVITPHTAHVTVEHGEITNAVLDQKWNIMEQKPIQG